MHLCAVAAFNYWDRLGSANKVEYKTEEEVYEAVTKSIGALEFVKNQTHDLLMYAVGIHGGEVLTFVWNQTPELCLEVVEIDGLALKYVWMQTMEVILAAVRQNGLAVEFADQDYDLREVNHVAVSQNGLALQFIIEDQTENLCVAAVRQNGLALKHVRKDTEKIVLAAVRQNGLALEHAVDHKASDVYYEIALKSQQIPKCAGTPPKGPNEFFNEVNRSGRLCNFNIYVYLRILKLDDTQLEMRLEEIEKEQVYARDMVQIKPLFFVEGEIIDVCAARDILAGLKLKFVHVQTLELCFAAEAYIPALLKYLRETTDAPLHYALASSGKELSEICSEALDQNGLTLQFCDFKTPEACLKAVQQNGLALEFVEEQSTEVVLAALKQNKKAFRFVEDPSPLLCLILVKKDEDLFKYVPKRLVSLVRNMWMQFVVERAHCLK